MPGEVDFTEILVPPLAGMVRQVCQAVADAQSALDRAALETQTRLGELYPELDGIGYQVTWYQLPEVLVDLKVALHYEKTQAGGKGRLLAAMFNAKYKNAYSYTAEGSSSIKLKVVPVPPPLAVPPQPPGTEPLPPGAQA